MNREKERGPIKKCVPYCLSGGTMPAGDSGNLGQENPEPQEISARAWTELKAHTTKSQREQAGNPGNCCNIKTRGL